MALCLVVGILWGFGFIATSAALDAFGPYQVLLVRFAGAAVLAWITCIITKVKFSKQVWFKGAVCGILMYAAFAFQTFGLKYSDAGSNAFLTAANVVIVPWLSWMVFGRRPAMRKLAACLLCFAGIGCMSLAQGSFSLRWGDLLSLVCAVLFAAQIVGLEWAGDLDAAAVNTVQLTVAGILSVPMALMSDGWPQNVSVQALGSVLYLVVFSTWLAFLLQTSAQRHLEASTASLLLCTESLWANVFAVLFLHEILPMISLLGGGLIMISVFMAESSGS